MDPPDMEPDAEAKPTEFCVMGSVNRATLSEQIARAIKDFIVDSRLSPGDKLPSERELSAYFQASRTVIREALTSLSMAGVVRTYHGKGTFVQPFNGRQVAEQLSFGMEKDHLLFDQMLELRVLIESGAIGLAVTRATEDDWAELRRILNLMRQAGEQGRSTEELDLAFHLAIFQATHNAPLVRLGGVLNEFFGIKALCLPPLTAYNTPDHELREHEAILHAMRNGDAEEAKRVTIEALLDYREKIAAQIPSQR